MPSTDQITMTTRPSENEAFLYHTYVIQLLERVILLCITLPSFCEVLALVSHIVNIIQYIHVDAYLTSTSRQLDIRSLSSGI